MTGVSNAQLLAELEAICEGHERALELIEEVGARLGEEDWVLPIEVVDALKKQFPRAGQKTVAATARRCKFLHRVWSEKYGPFNFEQGRYAIELMVWAIRQAPDGQYGKLYGTFDSLANHENVDRGFKDRAGDPAEVKFDVMELLQ